MLPSRVKVICFAFVISFKMTQVGLDVAAKYERAFSVCIWL